MFDSKQNQREEERVVGKTEESKGGNWVMIWLDIPFQNKFKNATKIKSWTIKHSDQYNVSISIYAYQ